MIELSIIIQAPHGGDRLRLCLEGLCRQTQPAEDFEVIVTLEGSIDGTGEVLGNVAMPCKLRVLRVRKSGPGAARNHGAQAAEGQYCLFLAADVVPHPHLVAEHLNSQRRRQGIIGIGQVVLVLPHNADGFVRHVAQEREDRYTHLGQGGLPSPMDCCCANLSLPRAAILKTGGFALDLSGGESIELAYRLECEGLPCVYIPDAMVTQECPRGFRETAGEIQVAGAGSFELYQRHPPLLPHMPLGTFHNMSGHAILLRRCLLAMGGPIRPFAMIDVCLRKSSWRLNWYRFLYNYCYWKGVRGVAPKDTWNRLVSGTTILMYHACGLPQEPASRYVIPGRRFARQMAWLKWTGYHVLSLEEFLRYHREHRLPPSRSVVITFDDGYADNGTVAYPILLRHGFPATIFVVSGMIGTSNQWDSEGDLVGRSLLTWSDLKEIMMSGCISIGSHTKTHVPLDTAPISLIEEEVEGSRAHLERELGLPILVFAYPHGRDDTRSHAIVERAGFLGSCSSYVGVNDPATSPYILRRLSIRGTYSLVRFALALWLGRTRIFGKWWERWEIARFNT
jgi:peptidoglycan/xylan/chitin deacetylase (PgdA/CDA1 family)/glycosyltransferase involved in cell wall biosynthesis